MSSDDELATALRRASSDLVVSIIAERRRRKGPVARAYKAAKPRVLNALASISAAVASVPVFAASMFAAFSRTMSPLYSDLRANYKVCLGCFFAAFFLSLCLACAHEARPFFGVSANGNSYGGNTQYSTHTTILAATYGGQDVTRRVQEYYSQRGFVVAHNSILGDPLPTVFKYLHVVYQYQSPQTGLAEFFSESFGESTEVRELLPKDQDTCQFPETSMVNGKSTKVLGALYEGSDISCIARHFAATGRFSPLIGNLRTSKEVSRPNFPTQPRPSNGAFTFVYLQDNRVKVFQGKEGTTIHL